MSLCNNLGNLENNILTLNQSFHFEPQKDDTSTGDASGSGTIFNMAPLNMSTSAISGFLDMVPIKGALSANASTNSLPSMDSDFGNLQPVAAAIVNARIEDLKAAEATFESIKLNGLDSVSNSACSSRKTSAISEPGCVQEAGSQAETPSEPTVDSPSIESKTESIANPSVSCSTATSVATPSTPQQPTERTRKLSRFLVSPVVMPDNTVVVPESKEVKSEVQVSQLPVQTQTIQAQIHAQPPTGVQPPQNSQIPTPQVIPVNPQIQTQSVQNVTTQSMTSTAQQASAVVVPPHSQAVPTQTVQYPQDGVYESVIQTTQYAAQVSEVTAETQSVMVPDPKWEKDEKHALISQQLEMAMGIAPSTSQPITAAPAATTVPPQLTQILPMPQQMLDQHQFQQLQLQQQQLQQYVEYAAAQQALLLDPNYQQQNFQNLIAGDESGMGKDSMDSGPSAQSLASITTLEQLQKELENITHVHVAPKKDSASATQNTSICDNPPTEAINEEIQISDDNLQVVPSFASQAELLQHQIQSHDNTSSISEITNINSSGVLSRDDTSAYNSRRTSTDMNVIDIPQVQQTFMEAMSQAVEGMQTAQMVQPQPQPPPGATKLSQQNSLDKSDR